MTDLNPDILNPAAPSRTQVIDLFPVSPSRIAADSHSGFQRKHNEDSYGYLVDADRHCALMFVADGIGGNSDGDLASQFTTKSLLADWRRFTDGRTPGAEQTAEFFRSALRDINRTLYEINKAQGNLASPMGTTIAALALLRDQVVTANAGDSRVYRFRGSLIERMTDDHSVVQKWVRDGVAKAEDVKDHPMAHVIYKSIGPLPNLEPDVRIFDRRHGDKFIACSDGLMCHMEDEEIRGAVRQSKSAAEVVRQLINTALKRGGFDNVTVVCYYQA